MLSPSLLFIVILETKKETGVEVAIDVVGRVLVDELKIPYFLFFSISVILLTNCDIV